MGRLLYALRFYSGFISFFDFIRFMLLGSPPFSGGSAVMLVVLFSCYPFPPPKGYRALSEEFLASYPQSCNIEKTNNKIRHSFLRLTFTYILFRLAYLSQ